MTREISRQAFVRGALGAASGVLVGSCRSTTATGAQTTPVAPSTASPPVVKGPPDWIALDGAIDGRVIYSALMWKAGVELHQPDPPELSFGFHANHGTEIGARELPAAIDVVESIVDRFATLAGPPT